MVNELSQMHTINNKIFVGDLHRLKVSIPSRPCAKTIGYKDPVSFVDRYVSVSIRAPITHKNPWEYLTLKQGDVIDVLITMYRKKNNYDNFDALLLNVEQSPERKEAITLDNILQQGRWVDPLLENIAGYDTRRSTTKIPRNIEAGDIYLLNIHNIDFDENKAYCLANKQRVITFRTSDKLNEGLSIGELVIVRTNYQRITLNEEPIEYSGKFLGKCDIDSHTQRTLKESLVKAEKDTPSSISYFNL